MAERERESTRIFNQLGATGSAARSTGPSVEPLTEITFSYDRVVVGR